MIISSKSLRKPLKNNHVKKLYRYHYIYFILDTEYNAVKIGVSKDVKDRLKGLQSANLHPLRILKTIKLMGISNHEKEARTAAQMASFKREKELHAVFDSYLIRNEWFKYGGMLEKFIEKL